MVQSGVQQQLAIALFEEFKPQNKKVEEAPVDLGFRRSNAFAEIVDLGLAGRRFLDVTYFLVADDPEYKKMYEVDLGLFKWLMGTTSNNRQHMATVIRQAQKAAIVINDYGVKDEKSDRYGAVPLMGSAFIENGKLYYELSDRLQRAIKNPEASHFLSLCHVFNKIHAKILFDRLQPLPTDGMTPWYSLAELRAWLNCNTKTYEEYKFFRSRILQKAIDDIKSTTGIEMKLIPLAEPGSKQVVKVRFSVLHPKDKNPQKAAFLVLKHVYEVLHTEFGLSQKDFDEIISNRDIYTDDRIAQAMDYTRHNAEKGNIKLRVGGYFMKALREGYIVGTLDKEIHEKNKLLTDYRAGAKQQGEKNAANVKKAAEQKTFTEIAAGLSIFNSLPQEQQDEFFESFSTSMLGKRVAARLKVEPSELKNHMADPILTTGLATYVESHAKKYSRQLKLNEH